MEKPYVDRLKWYSPFVFLFGAIVGFADPITDILTLVEFYRADHKTWFGVGLAFVILPCPAYSVICLGAHCKGFCRAVIEVVLWGLHPFSAAFARLRCFIFCLKNFKKLRRGENSEFSKEANAFLAHSEYAQFFEAVLESAPQFIFQLYAMTVQQEPVKIIQIISLPVSFFSLLAWASTVADNEVCRIDVLNWNHKLLLFVTHLFLLSSRFFALGFFVVSYNWLILPVLIIHSMVILINDTVWLCRRGDCDISADGLFVFSFCLHWLRDNMSVVWTNIELHVDTEIKKQLRRTQLFSNALFTVENIAMILVFYMFSEFSNTWFSLPVTICVCLFSVLGSTIRVIHFRFLTRETSNDTVSPPSVTGNNLSTTSEPSGVNSPDQPQINLVNLGYV